MSVDKIVGTIEKLSKGFDVRQEERGRLLADLAEWLYRAHVRELLERVASAWDTLEEPTDAEVVAALSDMSLDAPPRDRVVSVITDLFASAARSVEAGLSPEVYEVVVENRSWTPAEHEEYLRLLHLTEELLKEADPDLCQVRKTFWEDLAGRELTPEAKKRIEETLGGSSP